MSARVSVSSELLDQLFRLPDGVHIARLDRIPISGAPGGRWMWRMALVGDGLVIDGEATLEYKLEDGQATCEIRAVVQPVAEVEPSPVPQRRRSDEPGPGAQQLSEVASRLREVP